jgi:flagellin-specific chaperone FliS
MGVLNEKRCIGDITTYTKNKIASSYNYCKYGYVLYAFECEPMRYKCSLSRNKDIEHLTETLKQLDALGEMKYQVNISYPFTEKIMMFLLKQNTVILGSNKFEGSFEDVKKALDISVKLEDILNHNSKDLDKLYSLINQEFCNVITESSSNIIDAETPIKRKAKRSIDQINIETGEIIQTFESIEAAGRIIGLTGSAVGIALREKRACSGFLWRYSGISKEDQYSPQPVIKVCCSTGEKTKFNNIADSARDANISAPGLRSRILTNVHINGYHWIFDKDSTHYK